MAKFLYRDGANYKDIVHLPLPVALKGAKINDDIDVTLLGYESGEDFINRYFGRFYDDEYDHQLLELLDFDETDFKEEPESLLPLFCEIFKPQQDVNSRASR